MPITLPKELNDEAIQIEHKSWLMKHAPLCFQEKIATLTPEQLSLLNYPHLWSGQRLFETRFQGQKSFSYFNRLVELIYERKNPFKSREDSSAYGVMIELINKAQKEYAKDENVAQINKFSLAYQKQLVVFIRKSLLKTIKGINLNYKTPKSEESLNKIHELLSKSSLLKLQTRHDCLQTHYQLTMACRFLRTELANNKTLSPKEIDEEKEKIQQIEVLRKRFIDTYYAHAKKLSFGDALKKDTSAAINYVVAIIGLYAAIIGVASFVFPLLVPPSLFTVFASISLISYVASAITTAKVIEESYQYYRSPRLSDFLAVAITAILVPISLFGARIFTRAAPPLQPDTTNTLFSRVSSQLQPNLSLKTAPNASFLSSILSRTKMLWQRVLSYLIPSKDLDQTTVNVLNIGSTYTSIGQLKNTTSATSWSHIRSALATNDDSNAFDRVQNTKVHLKNLKTLKPRASSQEYERLQQKLVACINDTTPQTISNAVVAYQELRLTINHKAQNNPNLTLGEYEQELDDERKKLGDIINECQKINKNLANRPLLDLEHHARRLRVLIGHNLERFRTTPSIFDPALSQHNREFAYTVLKAEPADHLPVAPSYHAEILFWERKANGLKNVPEVRNIIKAIDAYKAMKLDAHERSEILGDIAKRCEEFLASYPATREQFTYVQQLKATVDKELKTLEEFRKQYSSTEMPVLVGFKAR